MATPALAPITRLGLQIPSFTFPGVPAAGLFDHVVAIAGAAEASGFDSLWLMDHLYQIRNVGQPDEPMLEAYTTLSAIAARVPRVRLGAMVTGVTYRNPALLAKTVTTLDVISGGRAILGIGAAWNEEEHRAFGFDFPPLRERFERLEEAVRICRGMFTEDAPTVTGKHYRVDSVLNRPRPLAPDGPPILIGGSGERKTLPMVARHADACNLFGDVPTIRHKLDVLERACAAIDRDPAEITKTRLGSLIVGSSAADVDRRVAAHAARHGQSADEVRAAVLCGERGAVAEGARALLDAGLDGLLFNVPVDDDPARHLAAAGEALAGVTGAA